MSDKEALEAERNRNDILLAATQMKFDATSHFYSAEVMLGEFKHADELRAMLHNLLNCKLDIISRQIHITLILRED